MIILATHYVHKQKSYLTTTHLHDRNRVQGPPLTPIKHTQVSIIQHTVYHSKLSSDLERVHNP